MINAPERNWEEKGYENFYSILLELLDNLIYKLKTKISLINNNQYTMHLQVKYILIFLNKKMLFELNNWNKG